MNGKKRYTNGVAYRGRDTKYGNKKTSRVVGGKTYLFDSRKEAERFDELYLLQEFGKIENLRLQPEFVLQESFKREGKTIRAIKYRGDFAYTQDGKEIVEDVKGHKTKEYMIKKKLFLKRYPDLIFKEIT